LANGDCGDGIKNPYPSEDVADKFWSQRRRLFTRFDDGIQLDKESWFSVTPEAIADHIASKMLASSSTTTTTPSQPGVVILDPFCGCGGNAIAFARHNAVALVVCVDLDLEKLRRAAVNAKIYDIPNDKMVFIHGNACQVISMYDEGKLVQSEGQEKKKNATATAMQYLIGGLELLPKNIDMMFLSPPWGGMDYIRVGKRNYTLSCIKVDENDDNRIHGEQLLELAAKSLGHGPVAYFLPRNTNGTQLGKSVLRAGYRGRMELEQNVLNGKLKTVTAYIGLK
jgi:trimethylguanosine synthase